MNLILLVRDNKYEKSEDNNGCKNNEIILVKHCQRPNMFIKIEFINQKFTNQRGQIKGNAPCTCPMSYCAMMTTEIKQSIGTK
ncbi:hypothetical protein E2986_13467 [Frieseomelitta varia]|uniref:Uncharacterized protein n=1 Tax=Frieseomelitta varia TaxID=561572 RepID=A0A833RUD0_9HYME|nr:hypothetical protein E2986_13467 [Frieseomelitta varia]